MAKRFLEKLRAKLVGIDGETLVETLVSTLIMSLVMLMLCTAIVSAAKVNARAASVETTHDQAAEGDKAPQNVDGMTVTVNGVSVSVNAYKQNGYYYYEPASGN